MGILLHPSPTVIIHHAALSYHHKPLFADIDLTLTAGKWMSLLGPSGIGKSSLLRMIAGLVLPEMQIQGTISVDNGLSVQEQTAYMAQQDLLLPWLTALDNALLRIKLRHHTRAERHEQISKAMSLFAKIGLSKAASLYPKQLSGGMRQRVALVRTLLENKPIVLMDEPFAALDAMTRYHLQGLAAELLQNKTVLFITHDPIEALRLANDIYIMNGRPAQLKSVAHLSSATPRETTDPETIPLQKILLTELSQDEMQ